MIEVKNLTKRFGEIVAIDSISFELKKGEILGFLGPNGAGKTTTMRILTCYMSATYGEVTLAGYDIFKDACEVKKRIGYLPETPPLYIDMTVKSYLDFVAKLKGLNSKDAKTKINRVVDKCGLGDVLNRIIGNLSRGFRQRVGIAQSIVHEPEILILDEPTSGLDPVQINEIRNFIKSLKGEHSIILSTHILPEVTMTCDRALVINKGKVIAQESLETLTHGKTLEDAFLDLVTKGQN
jgi:ABC-2 type transport system ATP-binding protein